jgi:hypothetical protein
LHVLLRSKKKEQGESLPPGAPYGVVCGQSSASCSFAHSLTAAPRLYPHLHQKKPEVPPNYTDSCQQRIDSLCVADLRLIQAQTSFGKD